MLSKLKKNRLLIGIFLYIGITNALIILNLDYFYIKTFFSSIFLLIIPGLLLLLMMRFKQEDILSYFIFILGLSIAFIIFMGLILNGVLPLIGIDKPLATLPMLISFDVAFLVLLIISFIKNKNNTIKLNIPEFNYIDTTFFFLAILFPVLSVFGTNILNNGGSNNINLIMLGGIALYVIAVVALGKRINKNIYPWAILMISISLLLMFSLRSRYIIGYDIHQEYLMFQATRENFLWTMKNFPGNAYNACLSITIFPTILSSFLDIGDEYIFKLVIQVIFSVVPVIVFIFLRKFFEDIVAFLSAFFFMAQFQFMQQMPSLIRQEISILFFALFLLVLFDRKINQFSRYALLVIFGFAMIVSHYSTTYICLILFIFSYTVWLFYRKTQNRRVFSRIYEWLRLKKKGNKKEKVNSHLNIILIVVLLIFGFLWTFQLTKSSGNLVNVAKNTASNIGKIFSNELRSEQAQLALGGSATTYTAEDIKDYQNEITRDFLENKTWINYYDPSEYIEYEIEPRYSDTISAPNNKVETVSNYFKTIINRALQILIIIGILYLVFFKFRERKINAEYIIMCLGSLILLGGILIVPYISIAYNTERLFQQILILVSAAPILGAAAIFRFIRNKNRIYIVMSVMIVFFFLYFSGFTTQFFGGKPGLNLNNFGDEYERFYTHRSEVSSLEWLSNEFDAEYELYIDKYAGLKAIYFENLYHRSPIPYILPSIIDRNGYVYSSNSNTINKTIGVRYDHMSLKYNYPVKFLVNNKNKIYDNGSSEIYK